MRRRRVLPLVAVATAAVLLAGCAPAEAPAPRESSGPVETLIPAPAGTVVEGLAAPWSVTFVGSTALVSERDSRRILEVDKGDRLREVAVIDGVTGTGEGGLLGIAAHDGWLYVYSTGANGNRIDRFELDGAPGSLTLSEPEVVLDGIPAAPTHNGGRIAFGPDGMLYATVGDARNLAAPQDLSILGGKILRMTPTGEMPDDNPFPGSLVYSYGHRNPQGIAWAADGTMFASEFGQNTWDELNIITPGSNYGWPVVEGAAGQEGFVDPVQQWPTNLASPSGIAVVGDEVWIANLRGERLRRVPVADPSTSVEVAVGEWGRLRDVALAPDGTVWVLTSNLDGRGTPRPGDDRIERLQAQED